MLTAQDVKVPLDVPGEYTGEYVRNYLKITQNSGRLLLFAGDQKIEHLNMDFYGEDIAPEDSNPHHLFNIASRSRVGVFASQLGLIAKHGMDYRDVPYLVKLNSKTNLVKTKQEEPLSSSLYSIDDVVDFKCQSGLNILGIGYTFYIGSEHESEMLTQAAQAVHQAHRHGLIAVIWAYARGEAVQNERDPKIIAGAAGVASAIGADFAKVNCPEVDGHQSAEALNIAVKAAGNTQVVCSGGSQKDPEQFLHSLHDQIHIGGASGNGTGRNIHQKNFDDAVNFINAIHAVVIDNKSVSEAMEVYHAQ
ncbi:MAG: aldolase [Candidatus Dojkabacteria bacterium]